MVSTRPVPVAVPLLRAVSTGGATTHLLPDETDTVPVPWHFVQVLNAVSAPHVGDMLQWQLAAEQVPV
jgi:hypothetical protein